MGKQEEVKRMVRGKQSPSGSEKAEDHNVPPTENLGGGAKDGDLSAIGVEPSGCEASGGCWRDVERSRCAMLLPGSRLCLGKNQGEFSNASWHPLMAATLGMMRPQR